MALYFILSAFTSSPVSLLAATEACDFLYCMYAYALY